MSYPETAVLTSSVFESCDLFPTQRLGAFVLHCPSDFTVEALAALSSNMPCFLLRSRFWSLHPSKALYTLSDCHIGCMQYPACLLCLMPPSDLNLGSNSAASDVFLPISCRYISDFFVTLRDENKDGCGLYSRGPLEMGKQLLVLAALVHGSHFGIIKHNGLASLEP